MKYTYEQAKIIKSVLDGEVKAASQRLNKYPTGDMGLTPDHIKSSPEFKKDKAAFNQAFANLRKFNQYFMKTFKKEYAQERRKKR